MMMMCKFCAFLAIFSAFLCLAIGDYVTYVRTGNKFEPVMEPVSSTIEPISIYKLVPKVNANDNSKYEKNTLLTVFNINEKSKKLRNFENGRAFVKVKPVN